MKQKKLFSLHSPYFIILSNYPRTYFKDVNDVDDKLVGIIYPLLVLVTVNQNQLKYCEAQ